MTSGSKFNWYFPAPAGLKMADIANLYMNLTLFKDASYGDVPWITVYTAGKNDGTDYWKNYVNAQVQYLYTPGSFTAGVNYAVYTGNNAPLNNNNNTALQIGQVLTKNNSNRTSLSPVPGISYDQTIVSPNDSVAFFSIQSNSTSLQNYLECSVNSFCVEQNSLTGAKGTSQYLLSNASVATNYMFNYLFNKNSDFSSISTKNAAQLAAYNAMYTTV